MSTREKIYGLIDHINPSDFEIICRILERFVLTTELPNQETIDAMIESDIIARDPNVKGYTNISDLMEALEEE
ncbi:MAG: hypothetical protein IJZ64_09120 [Ruminococcus sp.]|nr:hypothetical protein [Ruminococcus sp.]